MRDRLIELLNECQHAYDKSFVDAMQKDRKPIGENAFYADHLLAEGVIVPPCKVGDTVEHCGILYHCYRAEYYADDGKEPYWRYWATPISADVDCLWFFSDALCTDVRVITKEEAEKALAGRREG